MANYGINAGTLNWDVPLNSDLNDIDTRVTANETSISSQAVTLSTHTTNIATNTANIATNTTNIGTNTTDIATLQASKVAKAGDTMSGVLAMGSNKITGLANGTAASDAAAFGQIPVAGTTAGTYAAGNDSRITGALQGTNNLSDVANSVTSLNNVGIIARRCTNDETNSTTTQQASTQLVVPVLANAVYKMTMRLVILTPNTINFVNGFTGPAGATMIWGDTSTYIANISTTDTWSGTGARKWAQMFGTLVVGGTAGNLTVTFASGTAANTATLGAGSHISLERIS